MRACTCRNRSKRNRLRERTARTSFRLRGARPVLFPTYPAEVLAFYVANEKTLQWTKCPVSDVLDVQFRRHQSRTNSSRRTPPTSRCRIFAHLKVAGDTERGAWDGLASGLLGSRPWRVGRSGLLGSWWRRCGMVWALGVTVEARCSTHTPNSRSPPSRFSPFLATSGNWVCGRGAALRRGAGCVDWCDQGLAALPRAGRGAVGGSAHLSMVHYRGELCSRGGGERDGRCTPEYGAF